MKYSKYVSRGIKSVHHNQLFMQKVHHSYNRALLVRKVWGEKEMRKGIGLNGVVTNPIVHKKTNQKTLYS